MSRKRTGFPPEVVDGILQRDGHLCAMLGDPLCPGGPADEANHRLNRGAGGDPRDLVNSPANGNGMAHGCNWRLEQNAEFAERARRRGVKLDHSGDDLATILRTPMFSPFYRQWVLMHAVQTDDGSWVTSMLLTGLTDPGLDARHADEWMPNDVRAMLSPYLKDERGPVTTTEPRDRPAREGQPAMQSTDHPPTSGARRG